MQAYQPYSSNTFMTQNDVKVIFNAAVLHVLEMIASSNFSNLAEKWTTHWKQTSKQCVLTTWTFKVKVTNVKIYRKWCIFIHCFSIVWLVDSRLKHKSIVILDAQCVYCTTVCTRHQRTSSSDVTMPLLTIRQQSFIEQYIQ